MKNVHSRYQFVGWVPLVVLVAAAIVFAHQLAPWQYMWALSFAIFFGLKWLSWWSAFVSGRGRKGGGAGRALAYLLLWPGMNAERFLFGRVVEKPKSSEWLWAASKTCIGVVLLWIVARRVPESLPLLRGWIGLVGLIFLLHFGSFDLVAFGWQALGVDAPPIMQKPANSTSLSEFWGKRWNLGFRQLSYEFVFRPLRVPLGVAIASMCVFVASGLIHDLVISVPASAGYGLPTGYFVLQGLGVLFERSRAGHTLGLGRGVTGWIFMVVVTAGPAFFLFHPPFVHRVILPFMHAIRAL